MMSLRKEKLFLCMFVLLPALCFSGCATFGINGDWSGTTSQGYEILFTVKDNEITFISFSYSIEGDTCIVEVEITYDGYKTSTRTHVYWLWASLLKNGKKGALSTSSFDITENVFGILISHAPNAQYLTGFFSTDTFASGDLQCEYKSVSGPFPCIGSAEITWEATKQ